MILMGAFISNKKLKYKSNNYKKRKNKLKVLHESGTLEKFLYSTK